MKPLLPSDAGQGTSSQIALEVIVNLYAAFAVLFVARGVLLIGAVDGRVWTGRFIYRFTDPLVAPIRMLPGADRVFVGQLSLADLTLLAVVVLIPLGLSLRRGTVNSPGRDRL